MPKKITESDILEIIEELHYITAMGFELKVTSSDNYGLLKIDDEKNTVELISPIFTSYESLYDWIEGLITGFGIGYNAGEEDFREI